MCFLDDGHAREKNRKEAFLCSTLNQCKGSMHKTTKHMLQKEHESAKLFLIAFQLQHNLSEAPGQPGHDDWRVSCY